jgi:iron complex outermembrane receptor protein/vitamin B12 transporter
MIFNFLKRGSAYCLCKSLLLPAIFLTLLAFFAFSHSADAASVRGRVTDQSGAAVRGATVMLVVNGKVVNSTNSANDGSFQLMTGSAGHFFLVVKAKSFRQLSTPDFYAGTLDNVERKLVLEPEWVHESIVVSATGTATPQTQTTNATSVLTEQDMGGQSDLVSVLRTVPGTVVEQTGERGAVTSVFLRGADSDANKMLVDGLDAGDVGGRFDFGPVSTTALEQVEIYRGPNSNLYGADAEGGVVSFTTPHGTTNFPSFLFQGDFGNFNTSREELAVAGVHGKFDYYGAFSWLQTGNTIPRDEYHVETSAGNFGWQPNGSTQIHATVRYGVDATGVPNAYDFYGISDDVKEGDQDLYAGATLDNQTTAAFHNRFQLGATRKREESVQAQPEGICFLPGTCDGPPDSYTGGNYYGLVLRIHGANGFSVMGPALLDYSAANGAVYPSRLDLGSERNLFQYQGDLQLTPHLELSAGFHVEREYGYEREPAYGINERLENTNYDYILAAHGDYKNRFFYNLGASFEHYQLIGNGTSPRLGFGYYAVKPRRGFWGGTRINFSFAQGIREPAITEDLGSLYNLMVANGEESLAQQLGIHPIQATTARTWEGGVQQSFWNEHLIWRTNFFHNEFGREIEAIGAGVVPYLFPNLTSAQQQELESFIQNDTASSPDLNSLSFRALGIETTLESGIGRNIFARAGYTYLDSVVQRSFSSDNAALLGGYPTTFDGIPTGIYSPLVGARPFRRPPHTAFLTASYSKRGFASAFTTTYQSRADDSTFLGYADLEQGNSLVLPNRNLDYSFFKFDMSTSYQILPWLGYFMQAENLSSNQHIAPVGYPSLPLNFETGLRIRFGKERSH